MKEKGSYLLKELSTKAEEEEAAERPPPPPPPPVPPPPESKIEDNDLTGYGGAALLIFNGVMTGVKGGMMIEGGLLAGLLGAWAANRMSLSPANAYFGTFTWAGISLQFGLMSYTKRASYIQAPIICATSAGLAARYYYLQLQHEMKSKEEKEAMEKW